MTFGAAVEPIPWRFMNSDLMQVWLWENDVFDARITSEVNSFAWDIYDRVAGNGESQFLVDGRASGFDEAENMVREAIGKSYAATYGYRKYAGALATTFTLANGHRVDLGTFDGTRVVVKVRLPEGPDQTFIGTARVVHYDLHVTPDAGTALRIRPSHIVSIVGEGGATDTSTSAVGAGRMVRGERVRGCTGVPGFLPATVDHLGPVCPIHEESVTRFR